MACSWRASSSAWSSGGQYICSVALRLLHIRASLPLGSSLYRLYDLLCKAANNPRAVPTAAPRLTLGCICNQL